MSFRTLLSCVLTYQIQSHLTTAERALYAALAPSPQTSVPLKAACRTWTDHLWAQISVVCEEKESAELKRLRGSFWDGEGEIEGEPEVLDPEVEEEEEEEWGREVMSSLESLATVAVEDGYVLPPTTKPISRANASKIVLLQTAHTIFPN